METVFDDIDSSSEALTISPVKYDPFCLTDLVIKVIDDQEELRKNIKKGEMMILSKYLDDIRQHRLTIMHDTNINEKIARLCQRALIEKLTPLDRIYFNAYYRKVLRAQLELKYQQKEFASNIIITNVMNVQIDKLILTTLRLLKIMCAFLAIPSIAQGGTFTTDKLYNPAFWSSLSAKFVPIFGENRIEILSDHQLQGMSEKLTSGPKRFIQAQTLMFLTEVFNRWCGTTLRLKEEIVYVYPSEFVTNILTTLRPDL